MVLGGTDLAYGGKAACTDYAVVRNVDQALVNSGLVDKALDEHGGGVGSCGCSSTEAGSAALLSLLAILWAARRRRTV